MPKYNKAYYKQYISGNKTEPLLELLFQQSGEYLAKYKNAKVQDAYDALIMLMGEWKSIQEEEDLGVIELSSTKTNKARIKKLILKIVDNLPSDYFDFFNGVKKEPPVSKVTVTTPQSPSFLETHKKKIGIGVVALLFLMIGRQLVSSMFSKENKGENIAQIDTTDTLKNRTTTPEIPVIKKAPSTKVEKANKQTTKLIENKNRKQVALEQELIYKEILGNHQRAAFTGIEKRNDTTFVNALQLKSRDSSSIEYRIESLINWKSKDNIRGIASLDNSCLGSEKWKIKDEEGKTKSAFRFIEDKDDCQIEILISKKDYKNSIAMVRQICKNKTTDLTVKMRYK